MFIILTIATNIAMFLYLVCFVCLCFPNCGCKSCVLLNKKKKEKPKRRGGRSQYKKYKKAQDKYTKAYDILIECCEESEQIYKLKLFLSAKQNYHRVALKNTHSNANIKYHIFELQLVDKAIEDLEELDKNEHERDCFYDSLDYYCYIQGVSKYAVIGTNSQNQNCDSDIVDRILVFLGL